ncbi:hypothetical protein Hanom_Chr11g01058921 [Helianthus anomalus]
MAQRGKEETFVRRFAAGGNDGVPFNPRGYGDYSRRFAARGNEIVDHENFRESCDGYHPRRFAALGNEDPDLIYDFSPVFDDYEDDVWYAWATSGSYRCGFDEAVRLSENSLSPKIAVVNGGHMRSWDYRRSSQLVAQTCVEVKQTSGPENYSDLADGPKMGELDFYSLVDKMHSNTSFDPGGTSQLGDTTCEVKMFRRVMITIINGNRVDVPFDPGGLIRRQNSRTSFFRRRGV